MPKKATKGTKPKSFSIRARGGYSTGGETGAKIGEHFGNMLEDEYNKYKHHVGLARGGMYPAHGVGADIGQKIEDWISNWWNSLARGGMTKKPSPAMIKKAMAAMKAQGVMPAHGVGADVGNKIEKWITDWWNSLARGGSAMARGGMAHGSPSVFH